MLTNQFNYINFSKCYKFQHACIVCIGELKIKFYVFFSFAPPRDFIQAPPLSHVQINSEKGKWF
jgi:hypothetical protein